MVLDSVKTPLKNDIPESPKFTRRNPVLKSAFRASAFSQHGGSASFQALQAPRTAAVSAFSALRAAWTDYESGQCVYGRFQRIGNRAVSSAGVRFSLSDEPAEMARARPSRRISQSAPPEFPHGHRLP